MNYQYYVKERWPDHSKAVSVIRTESLWSDVAHLESLMGGKRRSKHLLALRTKFTHGSEAYKVKSTVTAAEATALCCGLRQEIQTYRDLIVAAVNLDVTVKIQTLESTLRRCEIARNEMSSQDVLDFDPTQ